MGLLKKNLNHAKFLIHLSTQEKKAGIPVPEAISRMVAPGKISRWFNKASAKGVDQGSFPGNGH